jgi:hypothetical protein
MIPILTTEHFTLQSARGVLMAEIGSRANIYLTVVSSVVVALAFVTTLSADARLLRAFALVLLPVVWFMGQVTRLRLTQLSYADLYHVRAINRIRHYYLDAAPETARYLTLPAHDDLRGIGAAAGHDVGWVMNFLPAAQMIAVVHYVITGLMIGLLAAWGLRASATAAILAGVIAALAFAVFDYVRAGRRFGRYMNQLDVRFPTPSADVEL